MDEKILKTRIALRNDSSNNWSTVAETAVLLKGEVGIEFIPAAGVDNAKTKLKIGDGIHTWSQLPYFGGEEAHVYELTITKGKNQSDAITEATRTEGDVLYNKEFNTHDVLIIKEAILSPEDVTETVPQRYQHTAYRWNGTAWAAFDGNYSADNVYLASDLTLAGDFERIGNYVKGRSIAAGTSLATMLSEMMQQALNVSKTDPTATLSVVSSNAGVAEVGTEYTKPTAKLTVTTGKYTCDGDEDDSTEVTFAKDSLKIAYNTDDIDDENAFSVTNSDAITSSSNTKYITLTPKDYVVESTSILLDEKNAETYKFIAKAAHSAGKIPENNLGQPDTDAQIEANSNLSVANSPLNVKCYGYRKMFIGAIPAGSQINSETIRNITNNTNTSGTPIDGDKQISVQTKVAKGEYKFRGQVNDTRLIIAIPKNNVVNTDKIEVKYYTMSWEDCTSDFKKLDDPITVGDARGRDTSGNLYNPMDYVVYVLTHASKFTADTAYRVTLK